MINKSLISNIISLSGIQFLTMLMPLIVFPYLVKTLGEEVFGLLAFSAAIVVFFQIFVDFGFGIYAPREIARLKEAKECYKEFVRNVFSAKLMLLIISLVFFLFLINFNDKLSKDKVVLILTFGTVIFQSLVPDWFFQGIEENRIYLLIVSLCKIIGAIVTIILVNEPSDYLYVPIVNSLTIFFISMFSLMVLYFKYKVSYPFSIDFLMAFSIIRKTLEIFKTKAFIEFYRSSNPILLGFLGSNVIVGYYVIAEKIITIIQSVQFPIGRALLPYAVRKIESRGKNEHIKLVLKLIPTLLISYSIVTCFIFFFSDFFIGLISSSPELNSSFNLKVLSLVIIFGGLNYFISIVFMMPLRYERQMSKFLMVVGVSHLFISSVLIFNFLDVGASISLVISEIFLLFLLMIFITRIKRLMDEKQA